MAQPKQLKPHAFKGRGIGTTHRGQPVGTKLPPALDELVRSLPNRSEFIRQAIIEKLTREGLYEETNQTEAREF
jgi:hypothetical protein